MHIGVLCERQELAEKLAAIEGIDYIYSNEYPFGDESHTKEQGSKWIELLPHVLRRDTDIRIDDRADGVLIRNTDELGFVLSHEIKGELIADFSLYTANSAAAKELLSDGLERLTYPLELNYGELLKRGYAESSELVVYGRASLMVSANCVYKNGLKLCKLGDAERRVSYINLKDRLNVEFPVMCDCRYCCNVIYNSVPTSLHKVMDRVRELNPYGVRLDFTTESKKEAERIAKYYVNLIQGKNEINDAADIFKEFTYGHFKSGVE